MKYILPALLLAFTFSASAGEKHSGYSFSVFHNTDFQFANQAIRHIAIESLKSKFPGCYFHTDKLSGTVNDIYGNTIELKGNTLIEKTQQCMTDMLGMAGIDAKEWALVRNLKTHHADFLDYHQYIQGHKVLFSRLGFRFAKNGSLIRTTIRTYGRPSNAMLPVINKDDVLDSRVMTEDINELNILSKSVEGDWLWFPIPTDNGYKLHPVWQINIQGTTGIAHPVVLRCYVDAINGKLLYRTNIIKDAFDVTVNGSVYAQTPLSSATLQPLNNMLIVVNGNSHYTNSNGILSIPTLSTVSGNYILAGKWVNVVDASNNNNTPNFSQVLSGTGNSYTFPSIAPHSNSRLLNAYYHTDKIHDYMKQYLPSFTDLDLPIQANVDLISGSCNAFYNGSSINFYAASNGCNSFAETGDIVYHEYGHAINDVFYSSIVVTGMENGALHEAYADVWAMSLNKDCIVGEGAYNVNGGGFIRRYDRLPKIFPSDIVGEVHIDGEIIAGAWWDLAQNINSIDTMTMLFAKGYYDLPDGPDGTEGQVYHDVLVSALLNDDNDLNLSNGTPHFASIASAFARHGIYLYGNATFVHTELLHQKANTPINVIAHLSVDDVSQLTGLKLIYRKRSGAWKSVNMSSGSGGNYTAQVPKLDAGTLIDYYFQATTIASIPHGIFPLNFDPATPNTTTTLPYQFGTGLVTKDSNNFETTITDWIVGNATGDDATTGIWVHSKPVGSYTQSGKVSQPNFDHTTGSGKCLVTGNAANTSGDVGIEDVDNGITTVISPVFDISMLHNPVIEYHRWYSNSRGGNPGNDAWHVQISDTNNVWYTIDSTYQPEYEWRRRIIAVKDYIPNAKTVQIKFIAADQITNNAQNQGQSIVEAGVDDFFLYDNDPLSIPTLQITHEADIYPNPANNMLYIAMLKSINGVAVMYNVNGQVVMQQTLSSNTSVYEIDTKKLTSGVYTMIITSEKSIQKNKIIIQH